MDTLMGSQLIDKLREIVESEGDLPCVLGSPGPFHRVVVLPEEDVVAPYGFDGKPARSYTLPKRIEIG